MLEARIRNSSLRNKVITAEQAASFIKDGMIVGMSGFTRAGDAKAVPVAMAARAATDPFQITLITGASLGHDVDKLLTEAHILSRRMPFQADRTLRSAINRGEVMFIDQHLSETVEQLRSNQIGPIDCAVVEALAITESGGIIPTTSVGNSASLAHSCRKVIVEVNLNQPMALEGLHDIYIAKRPSRDPIPIMACDSRIGLPYIPIAPEKIAVSSSRRKMTVRHLSSPQITKRLRLPGI
ncbi:succinate CoA transferase [Brucella neotomae]|nr:succinate CoA transferase [Brucella neotomae]